ncbi:hypothetical protein FACS1894171_0580 [Clostridia bacterium]|nr:hypothetical protein FACS1894171_0580 [Clostridia bacterium]
MYVYDKSGCSETNAKKRQQTEAFWKYIRHVNCNGGDTGVQLHYTKIKPIHIRDERMQQRVLNTAQPNEYIRFLT